jgi:inorganic triphosphatase YgiF
VNPNEERELKLIPDDAGLLDALERVERLGPFEVVARRTERQSNAYFDTQDGALTARHLAFRRRVVEGVRLATWTLKGQGASMQGISARPEVEAQLNADTPPMMALMLLRQAAQERGSPALTEAVSDALAGAGPPLAEPSVSFQTDRRVLDLEVPERGWKVELALDRVRFSSPAGEAVPQDVEIEVELKRGDEAALEAAREAISALGPVRPSEKTKLARAVGALRREQRR